MRLEKYSISAIATASLCLCINFAAQAQSSNDDGKNWQELQVTASAYTLAKGETKPTHQGLAAWGDILKPGMRVIAVSRDLIKKHGLGHHSRVEIEGLPGTYTVRDKMNRRWRNKIDILVPSRAQALNWGKRQVTIRWLADE